MVSCYPFGTTNDRTSLISLADGAAIGDKGFSTRQRQPVEDLLDRVALAFKTRCIGLLKLLLLLRRGLLLL